MKNSTTRMLTIAVVFLLLTNLGLIAFMWMGKNRSGDKRHMRSDPMEALVKEMKMSDQQEKDYLGMNKEHFKNIRPLFDSVRSAKSTFFSHVKDSNVNDSLLRVYNQRVTNIQTRLDMRMFDHFRRVRNLFTPEQQPKYDSFILKMIQRGKRDSSKKREP